jgi:streptogramin lyase
VADYDNGTVRKISSAAVVSTLAGAASQPGSTDGIGSDARFNSPYGVATDSTGNVYVADSYNYTLRKITPAGVVSILAGAVGQFGSADGNGSAARFADPYGVATDSTGNVYVADFNDTIRKITPAGVVSTLAGAVGQYGLVDGNGSAAQFADPYGVATDSAGNVFVADTGNHAIRKIDPAGNVTTLAGSRVRQSGSVDGPGSTARFNSPSSVATDLAGNVYVADSGNCTIRKITPFGVVTTLAGTAGVAGSVDGTGSTAQFNFPYGVATDSAGNVYVADSYNNTIRKIAPSGLVTTVAGIPGARGVRLGPLPGSLNRPKGLAVLPGSGVTLIETGEENAVLQITLP